MALSDAVLRDLQYMADGRSPVGSGEQALALGILEVLDRLRVTDKAAGLRRPPDLVPAAPDLPGAGTTDPHPL